jgi:hypothetical protein
MLPSFGATRHGIQLLLMNWPSQLCSIKLFTLENNQMSILHEDSFDSEVIYIYVNFEWFGEVQELQHKGGQEFFFQVFKYLCCSSFHSKDIFFLKRSENGFNICENIFMKFQ